MLLIWQLFYSACAVYNNGNSWETESVADFGAGGCLALDSNDNPHISYIDSDSFSLKYASYNGSIWMIETVDVGLLALP